MKQQKSSQRLGSRLGEGCLSSGGRAGISGCISSALARSNQAQVLLMRGEASSSGWAKDLCAKKKIDSNPIGDAVWEDTKLRLPQQRCACLVWGGARSICRRRRAGISSRGESMQAKEGPQLRCWPAARCLTWALGRVIELLTMRKWLEKEAETCAPRCVWNKRSRCAVGCCAQRVAAACL